MSILTKLYKQLNKKKEFRSMGRQQLPAGTDPEETEDDETEDDETEDEDTEEEDISKGAGYRQPGARAGTESEQSEADEEYPIVEREILPAKIVCPDCGGITLEGLEFCDKCGGELG